MAATSIEWADHTANPIRARRNDDGPEVGHYCEKISPGCANCYASKLQHRFRMPPFPGVTREDQTVTLDGSMKNGAVPYLDEAVLAAIRKRRKPTRYFIGDMTDVFGWWVPDEWLDSMFATFYQCPQHTFMLLTKRPDRMRGYFDRLAHSAFGSKLPIPNVWLGVSAEDQKRWDERVPILSTTPAAVRFVSVEPMLEAIIMETGLGLETDRDGSWRRESKWGGASQTVDWVIFGGESGHGARTCNVEWIRDGLAQCKAAGIPAFVKQLGAAPVYGHANFQRANVPGGFILQSAEWGTLKLNHPKGGDPAEWPEGLNVRQFPQVSR